MMICDRAETPTGRWQATSYYASHFGKETRCAYTLHLQLLYYAYAPITRP